VGVDKHMYSTILSAPGLPPGLVITKTTKVVNKVRKQALGLAVRSFCSEKIFVLRRKSNGEGQV
jgi:hypothetical protein